MLFNHLAQDAPLHDDLARLEQVLDVDILEIQRPSLPRHLLHGLVQPVPPVARDKQRAAVIATEAQRAQHARHVLFQIGLAQAVLEELVGDEGKVVGQGQLHAVLADDELAAAVAIAQRRAPRLVVDLAVEPGAEVAGVRAKRLATAAQQRTLPGALTGSSGALLRAHLAVRAVDVVAGLGRGGALPGVVALVDDGEVEEVAAEGEVEVLDGPLLEGLRLEGREAVDGDGDG